MQVVRVVVVACNRASDPSTWVGTRGLGLGMRGRRLECGRGLSMAAAAAAACTGQWQTIIVAGDT